MLKNEIMESIDNSVFESEIMVLESMMMTYEKAYAMLENSDVNDDDEVITEYAIVQEAAGKNSKKKKKKDQQKSILVKMYEAIAGFFKMIGKAIANFFKKTKDVAASVTERLRKFGKSKETIPDAVAEEAQKKADAASAKEAEALEKMSKPEFVENEQKADKKDDEKSKKTGIVVKERKVKTRIKFDNWIKFLDDLDGWLDLFLQKNISIEKPNKGKLVYFMETWFSHKIPASEVADKIDAIVERIKKVNLKIDDTSEKIDEIIKAYKNALDNVDDLMSSSKTKDIGKSLDKVSVIRDNLTYWASAVSWMTAYLAKEFDIYSIILDTIEPVLEKKAAVAAEIAAEAARKEKEAKTQYIKISKDDE